MGRFEEVREVGEVWEARKLKEFSYFYPLLLPPTSPHLLLLPQTSQTSSHLLPLPPTSSTQQPQPPHRLVFECQRSQFDRPHPIL
jgi:hypothetical protein